MSAIEYGSYYWCVVLNGKDSKAAAESVHLHADELDIDTMGCLVFKSAGRRSAGAQPGQKDDKQNEKASGNGDAKDKDPKAAGDDQKGSGMTYMAFAPGSWRMVYAAKLQDGSPALVEHWNAANGTPGLADVVPPNSGATGYPHRE
jgi:hypothetical protein